MQGVPNTVTDLADFLLEIVYRDPRDGQRRIRLFTHEAESETSPLMQIKTIAVNRSREEKVPLELIASSI